MNSRSCCCCSCRVYFLCKSLTIGGNVIEWSRNRPIGSFFVFRCIGCCIPPSNTTQSQSPTTYGVPTYFSLGNERDRELRKQCQDCSLMHAFMHHAAVVSCFPARQKDIRVYKHKYVKYQEFSYLRFGLHEQKKFLFAEEKKEKKESNHEAASVICEVGLPPCPDLRMGKARVCM